MTKDILSKIRLHLERAINDECSVVYLLAEVRKVLERDDPQHDQFTLWMYCRWALHVNLEAHGATQWFLQRVDDFVVNNVAGFTPDSSYSMLDSHRLFREFLYLDAFRSQLHSFLSKHELPARLCEDDDVWFAFLSAYAGVVQDGALSIKAEKKAAHLRAVSKVTFTKGGPPIAADSLFNFIVQWDIQLRDGRICRAGFEANPKDKMLSWDIQLIAAPP